MFPVYRGEITFDVFACSRVEDLFVEVRLNEGSRSNAMLFLCANQLGNCRGSTR